MKTSYLYVIGISLALVAAAVSAQQYKWKDARGRWQYGDVPPTGVKGVPLKPPPSQPAAPAKSAGNEAVKPGDDVAATKAPAKDAKPLTPAEQEMAFRRRIKEAQDSAAKKAKEDQAARESKQNCDLAREQERTLASGQRIARVDAKGERYYPGDAERARDLENARRSVSQWCK